MTADQVRLQRSRALKRAGLASGVAVALLLAVLMFEDGRTPEAAPATMAVQAPLAAQAIQPVLPVETAAVVPETESADIKPADVKAESDPLPLTQVVTASAPPPVEKKVSVPLANGYLVQLGVFGSMDNADGLRADVAARGLPAHVEGRVVVGPFPDKAAAEAARARLKREGLATGILVPPRKSK
jgi:DedD protein